MSDKVIINKLLPISAVTRVYSGRPGCACGCRGKYYASDIKYATSYLSPEEKKKEVNMKMVRRVYKLFSSHLTDGKVYSWAGSENDFVALDIGENRTYTLYFMD